MFGGNCMKKSKQRFCVPRPRYDLPEKLELAWLQVWSFRETVLLPSLQVQADFQFASALAFLAATLVFIACFAALEALGAPGLH